MSARKGPKATDVLGRSEVASRVAELLRARYFADRSPATARETSLPPMLRRLELDIDDFDAHDLALLAKHSTLVCRPKPKCRQCPLVSFCKFGTQQIAKNDARPAVVDLFGGAGGMGVGFQRAGFRVALAVEQDRNAAQTYRLNNPGVYVLEFDIARLEAADIKRIIGRNPTAICAGPPCQSFSAAGSRLSKDPRHHLFQHVLRVARRLKPKFIVIENVPGIGRSVGSRNFLRIIHGELLRFFDAEVHLLKATDFGVPQVRKRYFFIGHSRTMPRLPAPRPTHRPLGTKGRLPITPTVMDALRQIPSRNDGEYRDWSRLKDGRVVRNLGTMRHSPAVIRKIRKIAGTEGPISYRRVSRRYANTIIAGHRALPVHPTKHRTLSVREAALIQGFDVSYVFMGPRSEQPLQVANAVPPGLAAAIATDLRRHLGRIR